MEVLNLKDETRGVPLFPLPNVVFFPQTQLPLHIFEPRYRQMVEESLAGHRQIGMVLERSQRVGWPRDFYAVGGLGRIEQVERLEDGKFNILLVGISRFRILEVEEPDPYLTAKIEVLDDQYRAWDDELEFSSRLVRDFVDLAGDEFEQMDELEALRESDLAALVNAICSAMPITPDDKQTLLEIDDVRARGEAIQSVVSHLRGQKQFVEQFDHLRPEDPSYN